VRVTPQVGGVTRTDWRRRVEQSHLPVAIRFTLSKHAETGRGHFHDDIANVHSITRRRLARLVRADESTIRRHIARALRDGWLVRHRLGHNGAVSEYHYATPADPVTCPACEPSEEPRRGAGRLPLPAGVGGQALPPTKGGNLQPPVEMGSRTRPRACTRGHVADRRPLHLVNSAWEVAG
jgi:hypothetical protein